MHFRFVGKTLIGYKKLYHNMVRLKTLLLITLYIAYFIQVYKTSALYRTYCIYFKEMLLKYQYYVIKWIASYFHYYSIYNHQFMQNLRRLYFVGFKFGYPVKWTGRFCGVSHFPITCYYTNKHIWSIARVLEWSSWK